MRAVNEPARGIGKVSLDHLKNYAEPREIGLLHIPRVKYMSSFWHTIHNILRNAINQKFGEKGEVRKWMVNLMFHIVSSKERNRRLDIMDYMWQEMHSVVIYKKVPIYGPYLQRLFAAKVNPILLNTYSRISPSLHHLPSAAHLPPVF